MTQPPWPSAATSSGLSASRPAPVAMARRDWFAALAQLTYPADPAEALRTFRAYAPLLRAMPDAAFTEASLEHVACAPRRMQMPGFDDVRNALAGWWRAHRPRPPALPPPERPSGRQAPPDAAEKEAVAALLRAWRRECAARDIPPAPHPAARAGAVLENAAPIGIAGDGAVQTCPVRAGSSETGLARAGCDPASPEQASPEQASPEQASPEQASPEQASPEQASPEQASPEQAVCVRAGSARPGLTRTIAVSTGKDTAP